MQKLMLKFLCFFIIIFFLSACNTPQSEESPEFLELRIRRWTALEGGEILVLRKIGKEWSAFLLGDDSRFSCLYQKNVFPKSGWEEIWRSMIENGLLEIQQRKMPYLVEDGSGYEVDLYYQNTLRRFSIPHADSQTDTNTHDASRIMKIGNTIHQEFVTPVFRDEYDRNEVGRYLIAECEEIRASNKAGNIPIRSSNGRFIIKGGKNKSK